MRRKRKRVCVVSLLVMMVTCLSEAVVATTLLDETCTLLCPNINDIDEETYTAGFE